MLSQAGIRTWDLRHSLYLNFSSSHVFRRTNFSTQIETFCHVCLIFYFIFSEVQCSDPLSVKDGFIEVSNFKGKYVFGSLATYHCNPGFILWGNASRLCAEYGDWTGNYFLKYFFTVAALWFKLSVSV